MIFKDALLIWSCPPATGVEITPVEFELSVSDKQKLSHPNALVPACCDDRSRHNKSHNRTPTLSKFAISAYSLRLPTVMSG